ncbi:MAG: phosphatidate cytidylyltransferase [Candidatus Amulumruptor caecigallinarius]|nr:phosphatidate cytidylyltransferase [Candidatus Amulumruptor caecigallinarius]
MEISKLIKRTLSGIVYCAIIVALAFSGEWGILALCVLLALFSCLELAKLDKELNPNNIALIILDIAGCVSLVMTIYGLPIFIWLAVMLARFIEELYVESDHHLRNLASSMLAQIYIGVPMACMAGIGCIISPMAVLAVFFFLWINDTGAFLIGSSFGKHRLFEKMSPKKSWEGFFGGLLLCVVAACVFCAVCNGFFQMRILNAEYMRWIGLAIIVSVFGTWGDLVESMIKRTMHVKDSGRIIPGHGGILDRIDSLLLAVPACSLYFALLECL